MPGEAVPPLSPEDYRQAAAFRAALRAFLRHSEELAASHGLTPHRQLLLLFIKGAPDGTERATITELAEQLCLATNTVTDLANRAERAGLVARERSDSDGRKVFLRLTDEGERRLAATVDGLRPDRAALAAAVRAAGPR